MFIRRKGKGFYVVANYREGGKVRQKVLAYLGPHSTIEAAWDHLNRSAEASEAFCARFGLPNDARCEARLRAEIQDMTKRVRWAKKKQWAYGMERDGGKLRRLQADLDQHLRQKARAERKREQLRTLLTVVPKNTVIPGHTRRALHGVVPKEVHADHRRALHGVVPKEVHADHQRRGGEQ